MVGGAYSTPQYQSSRASLIRWPLLSQPRFLRGSGRARPGSSSSRTPRLLPRRRFGLASTASPGLAPRCTCASSPSPFMPDSIEVPAELSYKNWCSRSRRGGWSAALNKVEHYGVQRVTGDGRCMFRALAKGMAKTRGIPLTPREEVQDA
uniref:OTU domain-containing protein n=1 Tax=Triticum urartu TaxID=4572 RepID=A0A8R7Q4E4_TRIUA